MANTEAYWDAEKCSLEEQSDRLLAHRQLSKNVGVDGGAAFTPLKSISLSLTHPKRLEGERESQQG